LVVGSRCDATWKSARRPAAGVACQWPGHESDRSDRIMQSRTAAPLAAALGRAAGGDDTAHDDGH
jgi:hypothetical protein